MTIQKRHFDRKLISSLQQHIKITDTSLQDLIAAIIVAVLEMRDGNRTHSAQELNIPMRTFRNKLKVIESLGYTVPKPQPPKKS